MNFSDVYREPKTRRIEQFNEWTIMLCAYHYFGFSDFVDDPEVRYYVGYSLILVTIVNLVVNITIMLLETSARLWLYCKRFYKMFKALRA